MKRFALLAAVLLLAVMTSACTNTVEGFGKDMEQAGTDVQDEANDSR